jgi:hypothetical protein
LEAIDEAFFLFVFSCPVIGRHGALLASVAVRLPILIA